MPAIDQPILQIIAPSPGEAVSLAAILEAIYQQRVSGPVTLTLHCRNGVPRAVDVGEFRRYALAGP